MQLMVAGDEWELYLPSELGYGDSNRGKFIKGGDVLVFELEMLKVKNTGTNAAGLAFLKENKGKEGVVELPCVCPYNSHLRVFLLNFADVREQERPTVQSHQSGPGRGQVSEGWHPL